MNLENYIRSASRCGDRSWFTVAHHSNDCPNNLMMAKLDSTWSVDNGLPNFVTKLLHLSMAGYKHILPDVIGGHGHNGARPDKELYIRWMQAAALVPNIQFSYAPWDYDVETIRICKQMMKLRKYEWPLAWNQPDKFFLFTTPIWWADPGDKVAYGIDDG